MQVRVFKAAPFASLARSGSRFQPGVHSRGLALVIVLFAVALVSIVVLAYFNLALLNRKTSFSSAGQARANFVALSALDYIKADFISEIANGSTQEVDPTGSNVPIYVPTTNSTMLPYRMTANISPADYTIPPNLVKWSSGTYPLWPATTAYGSTAGPIRGSSGSSTTNASINGHFLSATLWTKPVFGTNSTFSPSVVPQWVYLTRQGPVSATTALLPTMRNPTVNGYVIGRYAYTVYDEGGLLDVAAAGYSPDNFSSDPTDVGRKGSQGFADLTQLGLTTAQVDQLVGWRNASSASNAAAYVGYLTTNAPATGFLTAATNSTDQAFVSRQDLIQYWFTEMSGGTSATMTNALANLTTFSREKNAPSWGPEHDAGDTTSPTYFNGSNTDVPYDNVTLNDPTGGITYAYHANRDVTGTTTVASPNNRFFPNVRVKTTFQRLSNEPALVGEPLVKNRFDLSKLAWITYNGVLPTGVAYSDIYNYFGLIPNFNSSGVFMSWTYNHTSATYPGNSNGTQATDTTSIMTLDQVASLTGSAAREPDYFELLQATILRGSLGLLSGDPTQASNTADGGIANEHDAGGEFTRAANPIPNNAKIDIDDSAANYRPINADGSATPHVTYGQAMFQVMQIGANIIDQYSSDNFPTDVILDGENFYGDKNLPYISGVGDAALRIAPGSGYDVTSTTDSQINNSTTLGTSTTLYQAYVHRWLEFALWNPHQNAMSAPVSSSTQGPMRVRIVATEGQEFPFIVNLGKMTGSNVPGALSAGTDFMGCIFEPPGSASVASTSGYTTGTAWIGFNLSDYSGRFAVPTTLNPATAFTSLGDNAADAASLNINSPDGIITTAPGGNAANGWSRAGIYLGWSKSPDNPYKVPACAPIWPGYLTATGATTSTTAGFTTVTLPSLIEHDATEYCTLPLTVLLQYEDTANPGTWHTYQELHNLYFNRGGSTSGDAYMEPNDPGWSSWSSKPTASYYANTSALPVVQLVWPSSTFAGPFLTTMDTYAMRLLDPRSLRLNFGNFHPNKSYAAGGAGTEFMPTTTFSLAPDTGGPSGTHFCGPTGVTDTQWNNFLSTWVDNVAHPATIKNYDTSLTTSTYYTDRDFVPRVGDAGGWTNATPLSAGTQTFTPSPLQLNRPFRSVAELGYVFRDDPWKTLNLISVNSADAGLLDVFYIGSTNSATPTKPAPDVIAGKMNINSAAANAVYAGATLSSLPLQALFSQTLRDYLSSASATGDPTTINNSVTVQSDIQSLSSSLLTYNKTNGPMVNIADAPGIFPQVPASSAPSPLYNGLKNPSEAFIRSLADGTGTRTWNLMIDVVAQAGKFNPNAASVNNFTVEGEKHYWLHVAIDRFTGQIVDEQLEPVWE